MQRGSNSRAFEFSGESVAERRLVDAVKQRQAGNVYRFRPFGGTLRQAIRQRWKPVADTFANAGRSAAQLAYAARISRTALNSNNNEKLWQGPIPILYSQSAPKLSLELTQCNVGLAVGKRDATISTGRLRVTDQGASHE